MSEPCADFEARGKIADLQAAHAALAMDYWGKDGNNGHRSRSVAAQARLRALDAEFSHYKDSERFKTCIGVEALKKHEAEHDKAFSEVVAVRVAEINAKSSRVTQLIVAAGVILSVLLPRLLK